ncbi:cation:proton antiporter [Aquihabitans daechungensis]|uniref:cation:proton antiporter n=1 Tax=Aquihabitans daechungensis TaxID=1052257 RepID=UPI003B9F8913
MSPAELTRHLFLATAVIVLVAYLGGAVARRVGQPRVLGEIMAGIVLGPSVLGAIWPEATAALFPAELLPWLKALAEIGLVLFMFLVGVELDRNHLRGQGHRAVVVSHASIIAPFAMGFALGWWMHPIVGGHSSDVAFSLFVGAAMAVTAFPVLARILQETGLDRTRVGAMTLACAAVDDVTAWCILAVVLAVAQGTGAGPVGVTVAASLAFVAVMWLVVRPLLARRSDVPIALAIGIALAAAWVTDVIGIHAIFGAFLAGVVMPRGPGDRIVLVDRLEVAIGTLLLPVFFMMVGLSTELGLVDTAQLWVLTAAVIAVAVAGKLGGAGLAARAVGESWRDAWTIGVLMNTRGLTEIVILSVGLERGIINETMFTIMVLMALATTFAAVPLLRRIAPVTLTAPTLRSTDRPAGA